MKIAWNDVAIIPDEDLEAAKDVLLPLDGKENENMSVRGTVSVVPDRLFCFSKKVRKLVGLKDPTSIFLSRELSFRSLPHDTKMEVKVGDRVLFQYTRKLEVDDHNYQDGQLIIPYDALHGIEREGFIYPLNGWVFIEIVEKRDVEEIATGVYHRNLDKNQYGSGIVRYAGSPLGGYRDTDAKDSNL